MSRRCAVCGNAFVDGEEVVSFVAKQASGEIVRFDVSKACLPAFSLHGELLGQWLHRFAENVSERERFRRNSAGKEEFFFSLFDGPPSDERAALEQLFALWLERGRVLRRIGKPSHGRQKFIHSATRREFLVPAGTLRPEHLTTFENLLGMLA